MKVLMIANAQSVHTQRWARALSELGHTITLASIRDTNIPNVSILRRSVGDPDKNKLSAFLSYVLLLIRLPFDIRRIRPDVVNPHYCITNGTIAALIGASPRVVNVWGSDLIWDGPGETPWWRNFLVRFSLNRANVIISTSRFMADAIRELSPNHPPIMLVPFGVDTARFKPRSDKTPSRRIRIGFVKTFAKKYAPEVFVEAAAIVTKTRPNIEFVMAGRGPMLDEIQDLVRKYDLSPRFSFPGFIARSNIAEFMQTLDILVNCSRFESFGVVICEASATGLPVVVTDVGGVHETVRDGETGILVPPDNAQALAKAMLTLADDPALREKMGENGRRFIKTQYEWNECVLKMETTLKASCECPR